MPVVYQQSFFTCVVDGMTWFWEGMPFYARLRRMGYKQIHLFDSRGRDRGVVNI